MTTITITGIPGDARIDQLVRALADIAAQHGLRVVADVRDCGRVLALVPADRTVGRAAAQERACRVLPFVRGDGMGGSAMSYNEPAFPVPQVFDERSGDYYSPSTQGMSLRDYFAAHVQADDRLVKCIRAMDDHALDLFALYPDVEREEHITEVMFTNYAELPSEVAKITKRLEIEAKAIARVRYMQADAMLRAKLTGAA